MFPDKCHASLSLSLSLSLSVSLRASAATCFSLLGGFLVRSAHARLQTAARRGETRRRRQCVAGVATERIVRMNAAVIQHRARQTDLGYVSHEPLLWHPTTRQMAFTRSNYSKTRRSSGDGWAAESSSLPAGRSARSFFNCLPGCLFSPATAASLGSFFFLLSVLPSFFFSSFFFT